MTIISVYLFIQNRDDHKKLNELLSTDENKKLLSHYRGGILLLTFFIIMIWSSIVGGTATINRLEQKANETPVQIDSLDSVVMEHCLNRMMFLDKEALLIEAIGYVESRNNPNCPGGGEMQITKVCVDAANKLQNKVKYSYEDRYSREKSIEIWHIIQNNCNKKGDIEHGIRLWNGGPGYTKAGTQDYYEKVMTRYNYLIDRELEKICRQYKSLSYR